MSSYTETLTCLECVEIKPCVRGKWVLVGDNVKTYEVAWGVATDSPWRRVEEET